MPTIDHALALAKRGMAIFPCHYRTKHPVVDGWPELATTDPEQITTWWTEGPDRNIAIATGAASGVFVVDTDTEEAEHALQQMGLPETVEAATARGKHRYFKVGPKTPVRSSAGKLGPHIDVRGTGGFVLAPPSIHPTGVPYRWAGARTVAAAPDHLIAKLTERANGHATSPEEWQHILLSNINDGQRDCTLTKIAGMLLRRRLDSISVLGIMQSINIARCKPPLPPEDIERIVASILEAELRRRSRG